jgi:hypothetical protein
MVKPIGIQVREAVKGWTFSMMAMCDDGDGEYPDSLWTGGEYATYFEAWDAAEDEAKRLDIVVVGEKKTQAQLDEEKAAGDARRKLVEARLRVIRRENIRIKLADEKRKRYGTTCS